MRLNKRALYEMAIEQQVEPAQEPEAMNLEVQGAGPVQFNPLGNAHPDGRISGLRPQRNLQEEENDSSLVSRRARRARGNSEPELNRNTVYQTLGHTTLAELTSSYVEQKSMGEDEVHRVQQKFYGLDSV